MQVRGQGRKSASRDGETDRQTDRNIVEGTEKLERGNFLKGVTCCCLGVQGRNRGFGGGRWYLVTDKWHAHHSNVAI